MKTENLYLRSIGVSLPAERVTLAEAFEAGHCRPNEFTGSDLVEVPVAPGTPGVELAADAARRALDLAGLPVEQLALLIHATMFSEGPEGWAPVGYVMRELGCGQIPGFEVSQGCNGTLAGVELAAGWLALAPEGAGALVTAGLQADLPQVERWRSAGFGMAIGDGGSALLLGKEEGIARIEAVNSLTYADLEAMHRGDLPLAQGGTGAPAKVDVPGRAREFAIARRYNQFDFHRIFTMMYAEVTQRTLKEAGFTTDDLERVVFTNAGAEIIEADLLQPLGLPLSRATWDFGRTIGHIGASDQAISLDHLLRSGQLDAGDRVLLVGGTQGYNVSSVVLTVTEAGAALRDGTPPAAPRPERTDS
ncbi:ketoacyl-ACP synthase III family protein [Streptomyces cyanogenus]|uniref:3-oxoacyl-[acyl-carrier-protein] synthase 3 n=1 Tax=Streptomyces cyanogenus TaxID=80860 RepID=A0ABX7TK15_STRCY|nr:ketoacyl-ACP synthase III family protein [Streptomyces cyanogenus]QTD96711.1 3-oxoacyl-[acyl-carrier-protein] synthase 3 [Streptomyces cyanogenus]